MSDVPKDQMDIGTTCGLVIGSTSELLIGDPVRQCKCEDGTYCRLSSKVRAILCSM